MMSHLWNVAGDARLWLNFCASMAGFQLTELGMESPEISRVGVALTLMRHSEPVMAEASRFAKRLNASLTLIHVGTSEAESRAHLDEAANRLSIPHEHHIVWNQQDPAQALLKAAEQSGVELLVMGAFEGPAINRRRFLGPVARRLAESARCSLLLLVHPRVEKHDFRRIVAITDFSECSQVACRQAMWLAERGCADWLRIVSIHTVFMDVRAELQARDGRPARTRAEEHALMENFVAELPDSTVSVDSEVIDATTGFAACDYAEAREADLLVLPGHNRPEGRVPPMANWALQVVPSNLWIVHCGPAWNQPETAGHSSASRGASPSAT
jgi:nucleotide-binding universal stress UspA family protein